MEGLKVTDSSTASFLIYTLLSEPLYLLWIFPFLKLDSSWASATLYESVSSSRFFVRHCSTYLGLTAGILYLLHCLSLYTQLVFFLLNTTKNEAWNYTEMIRPFPRFFVFCWFFSKSTFTKNSFAGIRSECQTVWIQIRTGVSYSSNKTYVMGTQKKRFNSRDSSFEHSKHMFKLMDKGKNDNFTLILLWMIKYKSNLSPLWKLRSVQAFDWSNHSLLSRIP